MVASKRFKKLRIIKQAKGLISYEMLRKVTLENIRKKRHDFISNKVALEVKEFLKQDSNSRMCPGKKDFVAFGKQKAQKRLLLDSMTNLHKNLM